MTPLIDVVFQLLIFFICASTGHVRELLLPTDFAAGTGQVSSKPVERPLGEVWIRLRRELDETVTQVEGLDFREMDKVENHLQALAGQATDIPVILEIQGDVPLGDAIAVYDAARAARFQTISFAAHGSRKVKNAAQ